MRLLFVADSIESFKIQKDSTYLMMQAAQKAGARIFVCEPVHLVWRSLQKVSAHCREIRLLPNVQTSNRADWFDLVASQFLPLADFQAVLMRKDPPFDAEYIYATHLLQQAQREGAVVFNDPQALRNHPEKLALMEFSLWAPPTLVTRSEAEIHRFHAEYGDVILKPLDGMGGMGIFRVKADGLNLGSIIETLNQGGRTTVMVQKYMPEITLGDKRILVIGGKVVPFVLARIPQGHEIRGNLAVGGKGVAQPLAEADRAMAEDLAPVLMQRGLFLVGLDVIGSTLTEVNVTSPTCFREITDQTGFDVADFWFQALQSELRAMVRL